MGVTIPADGHASVGQPAGGCEGAAATAVRRRRRYCRRCPLLPPPLRLTRQRAGGGGCKQESSHLCPWGEPSRQSQGAGSHHLSCSTRPRVPALEFRWRASCRSKCDRLPVSSMLPLTTHRTQKFKNRIRWNVLNRSGKKRVCIVRTRGTRRGWITSPILYPQQPPPLFPLFRGHLGLA